MDPWNWALSQLPFDFLRYDFMRAALLAAVPLALGFGLLSPFVVAKRMSFFSDVIGHSALTGVAIGTFLGLADPLPATATLALALAFLVTLATRATRGASDQALAVIYAAVVSAGVLLLSMGGNFQRFAGFLSGSILAADAGTFWPLLGMLALVAAFLIAFGNQLALAAANPSLARSRGIRTGILDAAFAGLVALAVSASIRWVGVLVINSLLILPGAASRLVSRSMKGYVGLSVLISLGSGIAGILLSFYLGSAPGATMALAAVACWAALAGARAIRRSR